VQTGKIITEKTANKRENTAGMGKNSKHIEKIVQK
jgi:hypothetical protein